LADQLDRLETFLDEEQAATRTGQPAALPRAQDAAGELVI
jgi:hypothetical protein